MDRYKHKRGPYSGMIDRATTLRITEGQAVDKLNTLTRELAAREKRIEEMYEELNCMDGLEAQLTESKAREAQIAKEAAENAKLEAEAKHQKELDEIKNAAEREKEAAEAEKLREAQIEKERLEAEEAKEVERQNDEDHKRKVNASAKSALQAILADNAGLTNEEIARHIVVEIIYGNIPYVTITY